ncbi:S8 family peptidase [Marinibactrum halimedae]|uniref:Peptidase S8/S53 domain-containing protein n=1 Tax=Marinibactrum halimedae TaxID=1444977 RepID=A0AA37T9M4_9GAMM|nr:S8 family serine peptidase [Marinibactrum halimedae]MCD9460073.1 S8 family serine peptidase [Marinibactrum halimedae]GLS26471.1 hypothetical protein GCM10007877_21870 [Marinibactrum halimedae]
MKNDNSPPEANNQNVLFAPKNKKRYLVASKRGNFALQSGIQPLQSHELKRFVETIPNANIVKTIKPNTTFSPQSISPNETKEVHVVEMGTDDCASLLSNLPPHIHVEEEQTLDYMDSVGVQAQIPARRYSLAKVATQITYEFLVLGEGDIPLTGVEIQISSAGTMASGSTNSKGMAKLSLKTMPNSHIDTVFAKAKTMYWDVYVDNPALTKDSVNVIRLSSLAETIPGFPNDFRYGWGQKLMGLADQESRLTGKGVKIAIIDSGLGTHELLNHVTRGYNVTGSDDVKVWNVDTIGHGTHVAGMITANGENGQLRGFCPEAEIIVVKVFPGGTTSALVEAIKICMEENVDVANLSLGTPNVSPIVEQHIEEASMSGVAMVVAAGNSGGPVQFPANSANTLAVSAIGATTEVRENTWDASQVNPELMTTTGIFSPRFTSFGPQVNVSAPGVSIVSTGPDNTYFPDSGTSMSAPHITGLAGLLLAHHPIFKNECKARDYNRVRALFNMLCETSCPLQFGSERSGFGLPNLQTVAPLLIPTPEKTTKSNGASPPPKMSNSVAQQGVPPYYYVMQ